jgi:hypothetical protein
VGAVAVLFYINRAAKANAPVAAMKWSQQANGLNSSYILYI